MARLVADASATLTWCFEDEAMPWTDALLANLKVGDEATVPAHWPAEVANALLIWDHNPVRRNKAGSHSQRSRDRGLFLRWRTHAQFPRRIGLGYLRVTEPQAPFEL